MKRQKKEIIEVIRQFSQEFLKIKDFRYYSIISTQYIESFIDKIIDEKFIHSEIILNDYNNLGTFNNKKNLLKAIGYFDNKSNLEHNITIMNRIRNDYAHNLLRKGEIPNEIKDRINNFELGDYKSIKNGIEKLNFQLPKNSFVSKYSIALFLTIVELTLHIGIEEFIKRMGYSPQL